MTELSPFCRCQVSIKVTYHLQCEGFSREDTCNLVHVVDGIIVFSVIWLKFSVYSW